jgi:transcriptional regulator with XRE-family HTH domain
VAVEPARAHSWQAAFGRRVRERRTAAGLSQMALASKVDLHPTYISDIERGERNVSLVNIRALAVALEVPVGDLFD